MTQTLPWITLSLSFLLVVLVFLASGAKIVPQGEAYIVERLGKFSRVLSPGFHVIIPVFEKIRYKYPTKDLVIDINPQEVITKDNAVLITNAVCFVRIAKPEQTAYGVDDFYSAIRQLVQTALRATIGEMTLDESLSSREKIKIRVRDSVSDDIAPWGLLLKSVEIQDIKPSPSMQKAMEQQAAAERERRAMVTRADGEKEAAILNAEGKLEAARREAEAKKVLATADREAILQVADGIRVDKDAALYLLGQRYVMSLEKLGTSPNGKIVLLPGDLVEATTALLGSRNRS